MFKKCYISFQLASFYLKKTDKKLPHIKFAILIFGNYKIFNADLQKTRGPHKFHIPLSSTHQFHTKEPLLYSPKNSSVPHQKPLSSTDLSVPHLKPLSSTHPSDKKEERERERRNWGVFGRWNFMKTCSPCVEPMCWTEVVCVELRSTLN